MYNNDLSWTSAILLFRPRFFSLALGLRGTQEARVSTECKRGPWPGSLARDLGVQSRENWQTTTGLLSDHLEPTRPMQTRKTKVNFRHR